MRFYFSNFQFKTETFIVTPSWTLLFLYIYNRYIFFVTYFSGPIFFYTLTYKSSRSHMFFKMSALENFRSIHRKTPMLEFLFNDVAGLKHCKIIKEESSRPRKILNLAQKLSVFETSHILRFILNWESSILKKRISKLGKSYKLEIFGCIKMFKIETGKIL